MNPFSDLYKSLSVIDLISIIDNPSDYQLLAVEAATTELASRQLTSDAIADLRSEIKNEFENNAVRKKEHEDKLKKSAMAVVDTINPISQRGLSPDKIIRITSGCFGVLFGYIILEDFGLIKFMLFNPTAKWGFGMIIYFAQMLIPLIGAILLWLRNKAGWILLTIWIICSLIIILDTSIKIFSLEISFGGNGKLLGIPVTFIFGFFFDIVFAFVLFKKNIRSAFSINKKTLAATIVLSVVWAAVNHH
ncbi:MAG TPA: hypothetical protein VHB54_06265 [Mucilaginibacter sp.]|nr:hypothetical protein [Mucilaginibacter sp.]